MDGRLYISSKLLTDGHNATNSRAHFALLVRLVYSGCGECHETKVDLVERSRAFRASIELRNS